MAPILRMLSVVALAWPMAAQATWLRAETTSFIGYSHGSEKQLRARMHQLQDFDRLLRFVSGTEAPPSVAKLPVFFINERELETLGVRAMRVDGFYIALPGLIGAFVATDRAAQGFGNGINTVLFHEYTHHFMFQYYPAAYPAWFVEGYAEYMSTATFSTGRTEFGDYDGGRVNMLLREPWLPMKTVLTTRVADLKTEQVGAFYAQSWLAAHYLSRDPERKRRLKDYLERVAAGAPPEAAFTDAIGMTMDQFTAALHGYLEGKGFSRTRLTGRGAGPSDGDPVTSLTVLPKSADTLLVPATRLAMFGGTRNDPKLRDAIRTEAAKYPGDAYAEAVLAEAELKLGSLDAAVQHLDAALAVAPEDPDFLYLRGLAGLRAAAVARRTGKDPADALREARIALTSANKARPDDFRILFAHALASRQHGIPDTELPVLLHAAELAPQVGPIAILAAQALARRGRMAEAKVLLTPVANDPHAGPQANAAAALLARIVRAGTGKCDCGEDEPDNGVAKPVD